MPGIYPRFIQKVWALVLMLIRAKALSYLQWRRRVWPCASTSSYYIILVKMMKRWMVQMGGFRHYLWYGDK